MQQLLDSQAVNDKFWQNEDLGVDSFKNEIPLKRRNENGGDNYLSSRDKINMDELIQSN